MKHRTHPCRRIARLGALGTALVLGAGACASAPDPMPTGEYVEATPEPPPEPEMVVVGVPYAQPVAGQARPAPPAEPTAAQIEQATRQPRDPQQVLEQANQKARQAPVPEGFINSNAVYDYMPHSLYQVWGAPNHLTMVTFAPGEQVYSYAAGDTIRWQVEKTFSGSGDQRRLHLLVQPIRRDLHTTMVVTTSVGTYHFELKSFQHTYMANVSFNHPRQKLVQLAHASQGAPEAQARGARPAQGSSSKLAVDLDQIEDRYQFIVADRDDPPRWMPRGVFHDGQRTFIDFGRELGEQELPALFVLSKARKPRLVQYHVQGRYMIVGEVLEFGVLRLGKHEDGEQVGLELKPEAR